MRHLSILVYHPERAPAVDLSRVDLRAIGRIRRDDRAQVLVTRGLLPPPPPVKAPRPGRANARGTAESGAPVRGRRS
jgi:hypothetical protein